MHGLYNLLQSLHNKNDAGEIGRNRARISSEKWKMPAARYSVGVETEPVLSDNKNTIDF